jgi:hypothetical protein
MTPQEHIDRAIEETTAALADGLDIGDLATLIRNGIEIADKLDDVPGDQKRDLTLAYVTDLLDQFWDKATPQMEAAIAALDVPYLSEGMEAAIFDPIAKRLAPPLVLSLMKQLLPNLVDLVVAASKGGVQVNVELWLKMANVIDLLQKHGPIILEALDVFTNSFFDRQLTIEEAGKHDDSQEALDALSELARTL